MKSKWRGMLSVVAAVFLLSLLAVPVAADTTTATRAIGDTTLDVGQSTTVTVSIATDEFAVVLKDVVPAGWVVSDGVASSGLPWKEDTNEFIWFSGTSLGTITASYTLTVPAGAEGTTGYINGTVTDNEENVVATVGGDSAITVGGAPGTTATRAITDTSLEVGDSTAVTVTIVTDEFAVVLKDVVPAGWVVSDGVASSGLPWKEDTNEFIWFSATSLGTITASYTLTVPAGAEGTTGYINGTVTDNEENVVATVGGDCAITVEEEAPPPGDYPVLSWWLTTL